MIAVSTLAKERERLRVISSECTSKRERREREEREGERERGREGERERGREGERESTPVR